MTFAAKLDPPQEKAVWTWAMPFSSGARARTKFFLRHLHNDSGKAHSSGTAVSRRSEGSKEVVGQWPAYRVSTTQVMTMQHRLYDCYWQMRMPELEIGSDVSVAADGLTS